MTTTPETIVTVVYPDETPFKVRVEDSDAIVFTELEELPGPCPISYRVYYSFDWVRLTTGACSYRPQSASVVVTGPIGGMREGVNSTNQWRAQLVLLNTSGAVRGYTNLVTGCRYWEQRTGCRITSIVPLQAQPNDCGPLWCRFTVQDTQGNTVYTEFRKNCPQWSKDSGCPPDTLDCGDCCLDCGDYLSDVRSLFSQLKQLAGSPVIHQ